MTREYRGRHETKPVLVADHAAVARAAAAQILAHGAPYQGRHRAAS